MNQITYQKIVPVAALDTNPQRVMGHCTRALISKAKTMGVTVDVNAMQVTVEAVAGWRVPSKKVALVAPVVGERQP